MTHLSEETLFEYIHGLLPADIIGDTRTHLASCSECASRLEVEQQFERSMTEAPLILASQDLVSKVLVQQPTPERLITKDRSFLWYGIGVAAVLLITFFLQSPSGGNAVMDHYIHDIVNVIESLNTVLMIAIGLYILLVLDKLLAKKMHFGSR